ncbi:DUF6415 family natural product biosynthesis protein [Streptomyces sp. BE133]|uniref:DUF6415 family natural product biosynthesis protein n=1 Tax=Streptomyces sp. BE133 TaxID=3002523 RepID=UPI002E772F7C|nr:DUF6415 family natural product biosynthesis protein [Streptomyces sp. BE133]MEE1805040.1 DUF6415 family natural product biosynthesis protein [Streptomyces sp. BE133]
MFLTAPVLEKRVVSPMPNVPKWTPPLAPDDLRHVLKRVAAWTPLDVEAIFDDLDTTIGNQPPPEAATPALVERLRTYLTRLSAIAVADPKFPPTDEMAQLIERGRSMQDARLPADHQQAVGMARCMAFVASDLVEKLIEGRHIKDIE